MEYTVAYINPGESLINIIQGNESEVLRRLSDYIDAPYQLTTMRRAVKYIKREMPMESGEAITIVDATGRVLVQESTL